MLPCPHFWQKDSGRGKGGNGPCSHALPADRVIDATLARHWLYRTCLVATFGPGGVLFVYGSFALELGSMLFNIYSLNKKSLPVQVSYQIVML